ncbi:thiamine diphosphokinase [Actibacterium lipolyticum]|uniref:Thiamine diphosphokinase n=1 Tax=Actibacterium lipolyticum TaxID=1524263 RepID=A0A238KLC1_9RHOB|nr:thiamine diphosphokinase [Actibacterium lipolyticum]SMX43417.1 Thiamin pyrophosphokinase, catalytic domain [Actibacterium lipolyticum]
MKLHEIDIITLIGGGDVKNADLRESLAIAPTLVAADGGADTALAAGVLPKAVFGDMDSISAETTSAIPADRLHFIAEQETTDFEKCLRSIQAPLILGLGFLGDRLDHQLAALTALARHAETRCILIGPCDVTFVCPPQLSLNLPVGSRVSLFPLGRVNGKSDGLEWPIDGIEFAPDGLIGTSNRASKDVVTLEMDAPKMAVILPRAALGAAVAALKP